MKPPKGIQFTLLMLAVLLLVGCSASEPGAAPTETEPPATIGSSVYDSATTRITLNPEEFDPEQLLAELARLPNVTEVHLPGTVLTEDQLEQLTAAHPGLELTYSLELLGTLYPSNVTQLDLSGLQPEEISTAAAQLSRFQAVSEVELMDSQGASALSPGDVKLLQNALPGALFHYSFELFGKTVSTTDERIEYLDVRIGNKGEEQIRQALDILTCCAYFKLDDCGIDSEIMAGIRDDYPDIKIVWRIYADYFSICTDETMIRMTFDLQDHEISELKYCTDVTYLDVGHNMLLTDISFVRYMPNLECVIISGTSTRNISALEDHDKLIWLEMCYCSVTDLSVLATCDNLKYLNLGQTFVSDLSALDNLPLERMHCVNTNVSPKEARRFRDAHPDCLTIFSGYQCYGYGWRYDDNGVTYFDYYKNMRKVFRYDEKGYYGNIKSR